MNKLNRHIKDFRFYDHKLNNKEIEYLSVRSRRNLIVKMIFLITLLALTVLLSACGGSKSIDPPVIIEPPVIDTLIIFSNNNYLSLDSVGGAIVDGYKAVIVKATYSQESRDRVEGCPACFIIEESLILGDDIACDDCLKLSTFLDYSERDMGIKLFIIIENELAFGFTEALISKRGYSDIVLVSSSEALLSSSEYNYELALIGETSNSNIDWHITSNSDCSAKCISPVDVGVGVFDGVIAGGL